MATNYRRDRTDDMYSNDAQVEYARQIAKLLRTQGSRGMTAGQMVLPGAWMQSGAEDISRALLGGKYEDIAGQQSKALDQRLTDQDYQPDRSPSTLGGQIGQGIKSGIGSLSSLWGGGSKSRVVRPGSEPDDKSITTGSVNKDEFPSDATDPTKGPSLLDPAAPKVNSNYYTDEVKKTENEPLFNGTVKTSRAEPDYAQTSIGFGTKARYKGEVISAEEAHKRFDPEWKSAEDLVDKFKPGLPMGTRAALTSLTYNAGPTWMKQHLGVAVQAGDERAIKKHFMEYYHAGGQPLQGLIDRRAKEVKWIGQTEPPNQASTQPPTQPPPAIASGASNPIPGRMNATGEPPVPPPLPPGGPGANMPPGPPVEPPDPNKVSGISSPGGDVPPPAPQQIAQQAQSRLPFSGTPAPNPADATKAQQVSPDYNGPIPPRNPIATTPELEAQISAARTPQEKLEIIRKHMEDQEGRKYPTQGGGNLHVPGNPNMPVTHMPGPDIPNYMGMGIPARQRSDGSIDLVLPGGQTKNIKSLEDLVRAKAELGVIGENVKSRNETQREPLNTAIKEGSASNEEIRTLDAMDATIKRSPDITFGPLSPMWNEVKAAIANVSPDSSWAKGIAEANTVDKLNTLLATEGVRAITNRGTNFEWSSLTRAYPNLRNSRDGTLTLVDMIRQEKIQKRELGKIAEQTDPKDWQKVKEQFYKDNPLVLSIRKADGSYDQVLSGNFKTPDDIKRLKELGKATPGMKFFVPGEKDPLVVR